MAFDIAALDELIDLVQNRPIIGGEPVYWGPRDILGNPIAPCTEDQIRQDQRERLAAVEGLSLEEIKAMVAAHHAAGED